MDEKLVTVATFKSAAEAYLVKAKLESEGIECFIIDEYISTISASEGAKLQVKVSDVEAAKKVIQG